MKGLTNTLHYVYSSGSELVGQSPSEFASSLNFLRVVSLKDQQT